MSESAVLVWDRAQAGAAAARSVLRRRVLSPILALLGQGLAPEKVALSIGLGVACGIFPLMGTTTLLCLAIGVLLRLNQPALQIANYLVYPLQVPLMLLFIRFGERLAGAPPVSFSVSALAAEFGRDPAAFVVKFGVTGLHGILGWIVVAPFVGAAFYFLTLPLLRRAAR